MPSIKLEGADKLRAKLRGLAGKVRDGGAEAVAQAARSIEAEAKSLVRVDEGDLRDGIGTRFSRGGRTAEVGVTDNQLDYGLYQEFGTSSITAKPFMTPAAEAERRKFPGRITTAVRAKLR